MLLYRREIHHLLMLLQALVDQIKFLLHCVLLCRFPVPPEKKQIPRKQSEHQEFSEQSFTRALEILTRYLIKKKKKKEKLVQSFCGLNTKGVLR